MLRLHGLQSVYHFKSTYHNNDPEDSLIMNGLRPATPKPHVRLNLYGPCVLLLDVILHHDS